METTQARRYLFQLRRGRARGRDPSHKTPAKPINNANLCRLLRHPYYKGSVRYKGVHYDGNHEALVDEKTWNQVQEILDRRGRAGEKQREHHHYLKGTIFCSDCGSRLIVSHNKGRAGKIYPYFICIGRQQRRKPCQQQAVLIETVEALIVNYYPNLQISDELIDQIRDYILDELGRAKAEADTQTAHQERRRAKLKNQQAKLLEAYYADAITLDMMKADQTRIETALRALDNQIATSLEDHEQVVANLELALAFTNNLAAAYQHASPQIRRDMNQAIFKKIYIDRDGVSGIELNDLFTLLLHPDVIAAAQWHHQTQTAQPETPTPDDCLDQLFRDLVDSERNEQPSPQGAKSNKPPTRKRSVV